MVLDTEDTRRDALSGNGDTLERDSS
jgi:hypothetical protein